MEASLPEDVANPSSLAASSNTESSSIELSSTGNAALHARDLGREHVPCLLPWKTVIVLETEHVLFSICGKSHVFSEMANAKDSMITKHWIPKVHAICPTMRQGHAYLAKRNACPNPWHLSPMKINLGTCLSVHARRSTELPHTRRNDSLQAPQASWDNFCPQLVVDTMNVPIVPRNPAGSEGRERGGGEPKNQQR
jgi:hypothetical protein